MDIVKSVCQNSSNTLCIFDEVDYMFSNGVIFLEDICQYETIHVLTQVKHTVFVTAETNAMLNCILLNKKSSVRMYNYKSL